MPRIQRPCVLACLLLTAAWLVSAPGAFIPVLGRATAQEPFDEGGVPDQDGDDPDQDAGVPDQIGVPGQEGEEMEGGEEPAQGRRTAARRARLPRGATSRTAKTKSKAISKSSAPAEKTAAPASGISFSRDVAPILVANCAGCHTQGRPGLERGKLDLTTFENLMKGTTTGEKVVLPGNPTESHLILRIKGEEEPRMPQGGNNNGLAEPVIALFEDWVKAGATLDAGLDPKAPIASYAASLADVERAGVAKLSPDDRLARITAAGLERWKKANPALKPEITPGEHFVVFSDAPKDRAEAALKAIETQYANLQRLLGPAAPKWIEKVSLYVFNDRKDYVEFVRTVERREVDSEEAGHGEFGPTEPYVAVADPHDPLDKKATPARGKSRRRGAPDADEEATSRGLIGLLTENMAESAVRAEGKAPRWLATGVGTFLASLTERRADYYRGLRRLAFEKCRQDWSGNASQVLGDGDGVSPQEFRAISFALVECLNSAHFRPLFPTMANGMIIQGQSKLDDVVKEVYGATRDVFLNVTGEWVSAAYGGG